MGIDVSSSKVVSINDQHQNGVNTSIEGNPSQGKFKGIPTLHLFSRNYKGKRNRNDGNPLIHALKGRENYTITTFWKSHIDNRMNEILNKKLDFLSNFDLCMPVPSSSSFCGEFASSVSCLSGVPILESTFLKKKMIGELLAECKEHPPKLRPAQKGPYTSQLASWSEADQEADYQAKYVDNSIRLLFKSFKFDGLPPTLKGRRVLVIDDIFATGSSLLSIRHLLTNCLEAKVGYLSFLSGNNGR